MFRRGSRPAGYETSEERKRREDRERDGRIADDQRAFPGIVRQFVEEMERHGDSGRPVEILKRSNRKLASVVPGYVVWSSANTDASTSVGVVLKKGGVAIDREYNGREVRVFKDACGFGEQLFNKYHFPEMFSSFVPAMRSTLDERGANVAWLDPYLR